MGWRNRQANYKNYQRKGILKGLNNFNSEISLEPLLKDQYLGFEF